MISITVDVDWASDPVLEDTLALLDEFGVSATVFATHDSQLLRKNKTHEIGVHPNFMHAAKLTDRLDELLCLYPNTIGVRCHSYFQNSRLLDAFVDRGIEYDSNVVMFGLSGIRAFYHWNGLVRVPVYWEDDVNCEVRGSWEPSPSIADPTSLYVFTFHPIHIFLNTKDMVDYGTAKVDYHKPERLVKRRNPEVSGIGTRVYIKRLLRMVQDEKLPTSTLAEISNGFRKASKLPGHGDWASLAGRRREGIRGQSAKERPRQGPDGRGMASGKG